MSSEADNGGGRRCGAIELPKYQQHSLSINLGEKKRDWKERSRKNLNRYKIENNVIVIYCVRIKSVHSSPYQVYDKK